MKPNNSITRIVGYAGTGKTTVLSCVAAEYGDKAVTLAPTNKAATVLRSKGIQAQTIHSYLYAPQEREVEKKDRNGQTIYQTDDKGKELLDDEGNKIPILLKKEMTFSLKAIADGMPTTVLVDEASMVGEQMFKDLCSMFPTVILFGDGFQLPPVRDTDILNKEQPDIFLDEVHRVAWDNPITRLATDIRNGKEPDIAEYMKNCQNREICFSKWNNTKLFKAIVDNDVQCICGKNRTRHYINEMIRIQKGYPPNTLMRGEQVVCLENHRETTYDDWGGETKKLVFYNGQILEINQDHSQTSDDFRAEFTSIKNEKGKFIMPFWNLNYFNIADDNTAWWNEFKRRRYSGLNPLKGIKMDYAYALTAHKAQGSEYDNVAVFDQRDMMHKNEKQRWYYTAVTRAKKRLLVVRDAA